MAITLILPIIIQPLLHGYFLYFLKAFFYINIEEGGLKGLWTHLSITL